MEQQYSSVLLERAVSEISNLPGIGRKTALRLALHLLRQEPSATDRLAGALTNLRHDVKHCRLCHNISDTELCPICASQRRDASLVCVVENIQDVMAIENTQQYGGLYHVLGGLISPMDGIGPTQIEIDSLVERVQQSLLEAATGTTATAVKEVILALSSTMEGDTTAFYINRRLADTGVKISVIARGISVGNELEYTDEVTLGRSILNRIPFDAPNNSN